MALYEQSLEVAFTGGDTDTCFIGMDIGASLTKIVYREPPSLQQTVEKCAVVKMLTFPNANLRENLEYLKESRLKPDYKLKVAGTGIGCYMEKAVIEGALGCSLEVVDEFSANSEGLHYCMNHLPEESWLHELKLPNLDEVSALHFAVPKDESNSSDAGPSSEPSSKYPALLCMCGSATAFTLIHEDRRVEFVQGIGVGGISFYGLGRLLCGCENYIELMSLAAKGNAYNLSAVIGENIQGDYGDVNFDKIASATNVSPIEVFPFGKVVFQDIKNPSREDKARALLHMVCDEVINWARTLAELRKVDKVYFAGSFLKDNHVFRQKVSHMTYFCKLMGKPLVEPKIIKFEGYLGAIGSLGKIINK